MSYFGVHKLMFRLKFQRLGGQEMLRGERKEKQPIRYDIQKKSMWEKEQRKAEGDKVKGRDLKKSESVHRER